MRPFLLVLIVLEAVALFAAGGALLFGVAEDHRAETPSIETFRPPIYEARIGDFVRYRKMDNKTGRQTGYLEYKVEWAEEHRGTTFGRMFRVLLVERDARGREQRRQRLIVRPRDIMHGFLPPRLDEEVRAQVTGEMLVVSSIETAPVEVKGKQRNGFLVQAVVPRESITEAAPQVLDASLGARVRRCRWEQKYETYIADRMEQPRS